MAWFSRFFMIALVAGLFAVVGCERQDVHTTDPTITDDPRPAAETTPPADPVAPPPDHTAPPPADPGMTPPRDPGTTPPTDPTMDPGAQPMDPGTGTGTGTDPAAPR